ncbi:MAG: hypothetical protein ACK4ZJ_19815 [Allorhizobium sp.]
MRTVFNDLQSPPNAAERAVTPPAVRDPVARSKHAHLLRDWLDWCSRRGERQQGQFSR